MQIESQPIQLSGLGSVTAVNPHPSLVLRKEAKAPVVAAAAPAPKPYTVQMVYGEKQPGEKGTEAPQ